MLLKPNPYLWITLHLLPINTLLEGEHGPIFVRILLVLRSPNSLQTLTHSGPVCVSVSISVSLTCAGQTKAYQFCKYFWDHGSWSWPDFFFSPPSTTMSNPPRSGSPPTGSASRLPPDLGAVSSRPGQYPSSQNPTDAPH